MFHRSIVVAAMVFCAGPALAGACWKDSAQNLGAALSKAYLAGDLAPVEAATGRHPLIVHVEHSLVDDSDFSIKVGGLAAADEALKKLTVTPPKHGAPTLSTFRQVINEMSCDGNLCSYENMNLLHNQLYLNEMTFTPSHGCLTVTRLHMVDGD